MNPCSQRVGDSITLAASVYVSAWLQVHVRNKSSSADLTSYTPNGEWELLEAPVVPYEKKYNCCPEPYYGIKFHFRMQRMELFYLVNIGRIHAWPKRGRCRFWVSGMSQRYITKSNGCFTTPNNKMGYNTSDKCEPTPIQLIHTRLAHAYRQYNR